MSGARVLRYEIPVDDAWHEFATVGPVVHVGCRRSGVVEFWAVEDPRDPGIAQRFIVVGTGHSMPDGATYVGTTYDAIPSLVWHLLVGPVVSASRVMGGEERG